MEQGWPGLAQYIPAVPADWSPRPRTVQDALDQLGARGGGAGAAASFVWRPLGTAAPGVYTTWATLAAAIETLDPAVYKVVSVDDSLGAAHITTGAWAGIENVRFVSGGLDSGPGTTLANVIIDQGASLTGVTHIAFETVGITYAATSGTFIAPAAGQNLVIVMEGAAMSGSNLGGAGFATASAGGTISARGFALSLFTGQLFAGSATGTVFFALVAGCVLGAGVVNATAGCTVLAEIDGSSSFSPTQTPAPTIESFDPMSSFLFQPGGTTLGGNVFQTWAAMMAVVGLSPGKKTLLVDSSFAAAHITAGAWNLHQCTLKGHLAGAANTLHIDTGVTFVSTSVLAFDDLQVVNEAVGANVWVPTTFVELRLLGFTILSCAAGAGFFLQQQAAANFSVITGMAQSQLGDGVHNVVTVDVGQTFILTLLNQAALKAAAVAGLGTMNLFFCAESNIAAAAQPIAVTVSLPQAVAKQVVYGPATAGNWNPAPTLVSAALDQLAAANTTAATGNTGTGTGTVTVTTGNITKAKNGKMLVNASCLLSTSAAASTLTVQLKRDATNIGVAKTLVVPATGIPTGIDVTISATDTAPDTAAHTYQLSVSVSAGTLTVAANSAQIQVVEDS